MPKQITRTYLQDEFYEDTLNIEVSATSIDLDHIGVLSWTEIFSGLSLDELNAIQAALSKELSQTSPNATSAE